MKRLFRHACAMLAVLLVMSMFTVVNAYAPYLIATTDVQFTSGKVSKYIPDTAATLNSNKGICYDLVSLFAAMCRSQDIPCTLTKGCAGSSYHAWNKVNVSGNWYQIDMTYAVTKRVINETTFAGCVSPLTYSQQSDTLAVSAVA